MPRVPPRIRPRSAALASGSGFRATYQIRPVATTIDASRKNRVRLGAMLNAAPELFALVIQTKGSTCTSVPEGT